MQILTQLIDLVFPPRETERCVRDALPDSLPHLPRRVYGCTALTSYRHSLVKAAVLENKFHKHEKAARLLAAPLHTWLSSLQGEIILIPIPLGPRRLRERGHNQVTSILSHLPKDQRITIETSLLIRPRDTTPQTSLQKSERLTNLTHAFTFYPLQQEKLYGKTIVIVDDVCTTGSTLLAAKRAIHPHLPESTPLHLVAIAH